MKYGWPDRCASGERRIRLVNRDHESIRRPPIRMAGPITPTDSKRRALSINGVDIIAFAFGAFNLLRLASYFPQIVAVARDSWCYRNLVVIWSSCRANRPRALCWSILGPGAHHDNASTRLLRGCLLDRVQAGNRAVQANRSHPLYALRQPSTVCTMSTLRRQPRPPFAPSCRDAPGVKMLLLTSATRGWMEFTGPAEES